MERLTTSEYDQFPGSWSSDGKTVALVEVHQDTGIDIALLDVRSGRVKPFLNSQFNERYPEFSPDGRWIAYSSNESERDEVYVRPFSWARHEIPGIERGGHRAAVGKKWQTAFLPMAGSSVGRGCPDRRWLRDQQAAPAF